MPLKQPHDPLRRGISLAELLVLHDRATRGMHTLQCHRGAEKGAWV